MAPRTFWKIFRLLCCCAKIHHEEAIQTGCDISAEGSTPTLEKEEDLVPPSSPIPQASPDALHSILRRRSRSADKPNSEGEGGTKHVTFPDLERKRRRIGWRVKPKSKPDATASADAKNQPNENSERL